MLITFSGVDSAGKSTQVDALKTWLLRSDRKPRLLWARGGYTPLFQSVKRGLRRILRRRLPSAGASPRRERAMGDPRIAHLWLRVAILDLILYWGVYLRWQRMLGRVVICDRYIDDTRLDFRCNFPSIAFEGMWLWRVLGRITPRPDVAFLLWVPVDESMRRSREKGEPFPDDEETLSLRLEAYMDESIFPTDRYMRLDCRRSVSAISEDIIGKVTKKLGRGPHGDGD